MKYGNTDEFKKSLDEHIKKRSRTLQEQHNLKGQISTERIMARIDPKAAFLQGGAATKYCLPYSPSTKDVDLIITDEIIEEMRLNKMNPDERAQTLQIWLFNELKKETGDHFKFRCDQAYAIKDLGSGEPCARVIVAVEVGRHDFHLYEVDLAMQNKNTPTRELPGHDLLDFADVPNPHIRTMVPEYIIADKLTLYLKERGKEDFERVNDIAHSVLLIQNYELAMDCLTEGLAEYAIQRDVVNKLIKYIPDAPAQWQDRFNESMEQSKTNITLPEAMDMIRNTVGLVCDTALHIAHEKISQR